MLLAKDQTLLLSADLGSWEVPAKAGSDTHYTNVFHNTH